MEKLHAAKVQLHPPLQQVHALAPLVTGTTAGIVMSSDAPNWQCCATMQRFGATLGANIQALMNAAADKSICNTLRNSKNKNTHIWH